MIILEYFKPYDKLQLMKIKNTEYRVFQNVVSCEDAAQQVLMYVRLSVCPCVRGQPENLPSYILLQHPECYRMFQNIPYCIDQIAVFHTRSYNINDSKFCYCSLLINHKMNFVDTKSTGRTKISIT